jgi:hypothetical protein
LACNYSSESHWSQICLICFLFHVAKRSNKTCKMATLSSNALPEKWLRFCQNLPVLGGKRGYHIVKN